MNLRHLLAGSAIAIAMAGAGAAAVSSSATAAAGGGTIPAQIRAATAKYHDLGVARDAGWSTLFADVHGATCIQDTDTPSMGGMGFHWVNGANIGSTDPAKPAALIFAPGPSGNVRLAGMEYLVPDVPTGSVPQPFLGSQGFMYNQPGNRFLGQTAFWSLHVWAWEPSPDGLYSMWNPRISCP